MRADKCNWSVSQHFRDLYFEIKYWINMFGTLKLFGIIWLWLHRTTLNNTSGSPKSMSNKYHFCKADHLKTWKLANVFQKVWGFLFGWLASSALNVCIFRFRWFESSVWGGVHLVLWVVWIFHLGGLHLPLSVGICTNPPLGGHECLPTFGRVWHRKFWDEWH